MRAPAPPVESVCFKLMLLILRRAENTRNPGSVVRHERESAARMIVVLVRSDSPPVEAH
jgi:hypothetical protein